MSCCLGALGDRYRVDREIGRGGMATVVLPRDQRHGRDVAIKLIHSELDVASRDRLRREVGIVARLNHPPIPPLLDSGVAASRSTS